MDEGGERVVEGMEGMGREGEGGGGEEGERVVYKVYKRRWFGLVQLVLLNIVVSWDVRFLPSSFSLPILSPPIPHSPTSHSSFPTPHMSPSPHSHHPPPILLPTSPSPPQTQFLTPSLHPVAHLLPHNQHNLHLLPHHPLHHKLAQHLLLLRLPARLPPRPLNPTLPPPPHLPPARVPPPPPRQLAPLPRFAPPPTHHRICRPHPRTDPYRPLPALRPQRPNPLLRPVVLTLWPRLRNRRSQSRQPIRWCPGPTDRPLPRHHPGPNPFSNPLHRRHLLRRDDPNFFPPRRPAHPRLRIGYFPPGTPATHRARAISQDPAILAGLPPLRRLRRSVQLALLPPNSNPHPLWIHRNRIRHRRRSTHTRRPRHRRRHLPARRPLQTLRPIHQIPRPPHRTFVPRVHLRAAQSLRRRAVCRAQRAGGREFQSGARGVGVFGRGHVSGGAGGGQLCLLGGRAVVRRRFYHRE